MKWSQRYERHGMTGTKELRTWQHMMHRCYDEKAKDYKYYGGRGITVCKKWRGSFSAFYLNVGPAPTPKHTLERKDNNIGYCPGNCCWATWAVQLNHTRKSKYLTLNGKTMTMADWARHLGMNPKLISERYKRGMSVEQILTSGYHKTGAIGRANSKSKLTEAQVLEIYHSKDSNNSLAKHFAVTAASIRSIKEGFTWKHLTERMSHDTENHQPTTT